MASLVFQRGPLAGTHVEIERQLLVGRGPLADLSLEDPTVSRRHALLFERAGNWVVEDLKSGNGTRLNGRRIHDAEPLHDSDEVEFGSVKAVFRDARDVTRTSARFSIALDELARSVLFTLGATTPEAEVFGEDEREKRLDALERRLRFTTELGHLVSHESDESRLLFFVLEQIFAVMPQADRACLLLRDPETGELLPGAARTREGEQAEVSVSRSLVRRVVERQEGVLTADVAADRSLAGLGTLRDLNIRSLLCVPLVVDGEVLGILQVDNADARLPFDKGDMVLAVGIAGQVGLALANSRLHHRLLEQELMQRDLQLARRIQQRFLPQELPQLPGFDFAVEYMPAFEIGGDYYDFLPLADGRFAVALGDVTGKGVSAALCMAKLSSELRYQTAGRHSPSEILAAVDLAMASELEEGMFVTLQIVVLEPGSGRCELGNAGHLQPFVRRSDGRVEALHCEPGAPVGLGLGRAPGRTTFELQPGEMVVLYTDGISEATRKDGELFGPDRLSRALATAPPQSQAVLQALDLAVRDFVAGAPQSDDITSVVISRDLAAGHAAPLRRTTSLPVSR